MIVAVTGATGYVGRFVIAELQRQGVTIRALARPSTNRLGFNAAIDWIDGDLSSDIALARLVSGVDAVIHLAYEHVPNRYRGGEGDDLPGWIEANVGGSLRLLSAARDAAVAHFVFLSSRAVFSQTLPGRVLDESHPTSPDTHYGAYKLAVESFLNSAARADGMHTVSIRATGVYGLTWPVSRSKWWPLIRAVQRDEVPEIARSGTEVHGADVARVIWQALHVPPTAGVDIIHMSDLLVTERDIIERARCLLNRPGLLPAEPLTVPANQLVCGRLTALGIALGGWPLLDQTVMALVRAAQTSGGDVVQ